MPASRSRLKGDSYWSLARSPLHCLIFLLPLLGIYEFGVLWLGGERSEQFRNGADYWMRAWLQQQGWQIPWLLPVLIVLALLVWQVVGHFAWQVRFDTLVGMTAESLLFACLLLMLGQLQDAFFHRYFDTPRMALAPVAAMSTQWGQTVSYMGAGIYEEVLFRLLALPLTFVALRLLLVPEKWATILAILSTSLMFSLAHYIGGAGDSFTLFTFLFRMLAGCVFAVLFVLRGFGITVGSHAAYDVLVGVVLRMDA